MTCQANQNAVFAMKASASMSDVLSWAEEVGEDRYAILELKKVAARMDYADEELNQISADLIYFETNVAPSPYGMVSRAADLDAARSRGNARLRALINRFWAARGYAQPARADRETYTKAIDLIVAQEGFADRGDPLPTSFHKPLLTLRARCLVPFDELDQAEFDRVWSEATSEVRKSLRKVPGLIERLRQGHNLWPEIVELLPSEVLNIPPSPGKDRARRILWTDLPETFRIDAEMVFERAMALPSSLRAWAKQQIAAGRPAVEIDRVVAKRKRARGRSPSNAETATAGYRQAITWLLREQVLPSMDFDALTTVDALFTTEALEAACEAQIARCAASDILKDADESSTLWSRFTNLTTLARHGLQDPEKVARLNVIKLVYEDYILPPDEMTAEATAICDRLRKNPHLAATYVHAPTRLHAIATQALAEAATRDGEERALRLFAVAAAYAIQVSRPLRPGNLFTSRISAAEKCPRNMHWMEDRAFAELRFVAGEVKNGNALTVEVVGQDAQILWDWQMVHRPRLVKLRGLEGSPYLFPGKAMPRLRKAGLWLPNGAMSAAAIGELWDLGDRQLGLGLTPHQCRHATGTLMLAVDPGNFASVASVLANTESVARAHYAKDSGEAAAAAVREALLAHHPDIFKRLKGRIK
ncbi:site-specific integrase [Mameliella sp. CS4]|uniref:site-specific integrase n=1 Tax=Mameliella sp. CS4 TaxID=2862329 RepID=UPI002107F9E9|nr:site-specific integrase [Mameliella sp. CS4]